MKQLLVVVKKYDETMHTNIFFLSSGDNWELISQKPKRFKNQANNFKVALIPKNKLTATSFSYFSVLKSMVNYVSDGE